MVHLSTVRRAGVQRNLQAVFDQEPRGGRGVSEPPSLGPRLIECAEAALGVEGRSAYEIFGSPDDMKLRSCATLFACVSPAGSVFDRLLDKFFQGERE